MTGSSFQYHYRLLDHNIAIFLQMDQHYIYFFNAEYIMLLQMRKNIILQSPILYVL